MESGGIVGDRGVGEKMFGVKWSRREEEKVCVNMGGGWWKGK